MGFRDPVCVYHASDKLEAQVVANFLNEAGIPAIAVQDHAQTVPALVGIVPDIHMPDVWIERDDCERARPVLEDYERTVAATKTEADNGVVSVVCDECGTTSTFPISQQGSVQNCPQCGNFVDVGESPELEGWNETEPEDAEDRAENTDESSELGENPPS